MDLELKICLGTPASKTKVNFLNALTSNKFSVFPNHPRKDKIIWKELGLIPGPLGPKATVLTAKPDL